MTVIELRDLDEARRFVLQGLWLQKLIYPPAPANLRTYLEWALEIASAGDPLPPVGFVADVGAAALGLDRGERRSTAAEAPLTSDEDRTILRQYEDYVLGKIYADWTFERAGDALRGYEKGRNWSRGLAFLIGQYRKRAQFAGVLLPPSIIRSLLDAAPEETLARGKDLLTNDGLMPLLHDCYKSMVDSARRTAEILSEADLRALENGIALAEPGQQLAHELVIRASIELRNALPAHRVKPLAGRQEVPTRVLDEDTYPVGGYTSIATKGSIESLLHSQLAYMERDVSPDLFDMKYIRDELYYYSRDENQFLRRRRTFVFAFYPDLVQARFKDPELHFQRIVLLLGLVRTGIQKLIEWLSTDALKFDLVFLGDADRPALGHEFHLLELLFQDQIENGTIELMTMPRDKLAEHCQLRARRSLCHCLSISAADRPLAADDTVVSRLVVNGPRPGLAHAFDDEPTVMEEWSEALERLLQIWV
jgi:hypothetical protein